MSALVREEDQQIQLESVGATLILTLDRAAKVNALSVRLIDELVAALEYADTQDSVRGVVLTGGSSVFSSGADLQEALEVTTIPGSLRYVRGLRRATYTIENLSKPVVAAIAGYCLTGGLELALACDYRIAGTSAQFAITSSHIGSVAGLGGTQRLPRLIGSSAAKDLLFTGRRFDSATALAIGVVDRVVPDQNVLAEGQAWIEECAKEAPMAIWLAKVAVNSGLNMDLTSGLALEALLTTLAFTTEDRREGMNAVLDKRPPKFVGR